MLTTDQLRSLRDALVALPAAYSQYDLDSNSRGIIIDVLGCSSGRARQVLYDLRAGEIITPALVPGGGEHQAEPGRPALVRWSIGATREL
jgi:hypothetical protein